MDASYEVSMGYGGGGVTGVGVRKGERREKERERERERRGYEPLALYAAQHTRSYWGMCSSRAVAPESRSPQV